MVNRSHSDSSGRRGLGIRGALLTLVAVLAGALLAGLAGAPAQASTTTSSPVSAVPANYTPQADNGAVYAFLQVGGTMYAGGSFTSVTAAARTSPSGTVTREGLVAFDAATGSISDVAPVFGGGAVWAIASDGTDLYVGGTFTTVNGVARRGVVELDPATGQVVTAFDAKLDDSVKSLQVVNGRLIAGGSFTGQLRALDLTTGADTGYITVKLAGTLSSTYAGAVGVTRFSINPAGTKLVAIGNFTTVDGQKRSRAFLLNLNPATATLGAWYYSALADMCSAVKDPAYLRDVAFSPDGTFFVLVATGYTPKTTAGIGRDVCDAAARFETTTLAPKKPTWINYTGGDTLTSVAVTGTAVYVQGHQRWLDNPTGHNTKGKGAVSRPGIAALAPKTGTALAWNPTKDRGLGGRVLYVTGAGLWVGSDTVRIAQQKHARLALLPAA